MHSKSILLVEDNHHDEMPALRALRKVNLAKQVDVVRAEGRPGQGAVFAFTLSTPDGEAD